MDPGAANSVPPFTRGVFVRACSGTSSKHRWLSPTTPSCPELFIVWCRAQALPASAQTLHSGHSICCCQRCQTVVTMTTVSGLNCLRCWSPRGSADNLHGSVALHALTLPGQMQSIDTAETNVSQALGLLSNEECSKHLHFILHMLTLPATVL